MKSDDTHPDARRVQIDLLRGMTEGQRFAMCEAMTKDTVRWSREAIREEMPDASEQEILLRWIEVVYGRDLAEHVRPLIDRLGVAG